MSWVLVLTMFPASVNIMPYHLCCIHTPNAPCSRQPDAGPVAPCFGPLPPSTSPSERTPSPGNMLFTCKTTNPEPVLSAISPSRLSLWATRRLPSSPQGQVPDNKGSPYVPDPQTSLQQANPKPTDSVFPLPSPGNHETVSCCHFPLPAIWWQTLSASPQTTPRECPLLLGIVRNCLFSRNYILSSWPYYTSDVLWTLFILKQSQALCVCTLYSFVTSQYHLNPPIIAYLSVCTLALDHISLFILGPWIWDIGELSHQILVFSLNLISSCLQNISFGCSIDNSE